MHLSNIVAARLIAAAILLTVASQVFYIAVVSPAGPDTVLRPITWFTELAAFSAIVALGHALAARQHHNAIFWSIIAYSGVLNAVQVAMGLSMFGPALEGSETEPQLFRTILAGAFFLYFLAKVMLGIAAVALGIAAMRGSGAVIKGIAALTLLGGLAAIGFNVLGLIDPDAWTYGAGAAGTAGAALLGALILAYKGSSQPQSAAT